METFKINGLDVPKETYQSLLQLLYVVGEPPKNIFDDNHVSGREIRNFLDASGNRDSFLLMDDLVMIQSKIGIKSFDAFTSFLRKHSFNIFAECYDFYSWIHQYDLKKPAPFFWDGRDFVVEAIRANPSVLKFVGSKWQADREIVLMAVQQDGRVLKEALPQFKKDPEIVLAAVKTNGEALLFADPSFRSDKKIVLEAVRGAGWILSVAAKNLRADKEVVLEAVKSNGYALEHAAPEFHSNREIVLAAVQKHGRALQFASPAFKKDPFIVLAAIRQEGSALEFADPPFLDRQEFVRTARQNTRFLPKDSKPSQDRNIKDLGWLADIFEGSPVNQVYKETDGGHALNSKRALQIFLFAKKIHEKIREEPKDLQILRQSGPDMFNFYHFAQNLFQKPEVREKIQAVTFNQREKTNNLLVAFRESAERGEEGRFRFCHEPFHISVWSGRELDLSYRLVPVNFPGVVAKENTLKIPANKISEVEIFPSQWLENNNKLAPVYTQYQLLFMTGNKYWAAVGKPIEIRRGCFVTPVRKTMGMPKPKEESAPKTDPYR